MIQNVKNSRYLPSILSYISYETFHGVYISKYLSRSRKPSKSECTVNAPFAINLAFLVEGLEGGDDDLILVGLAGHPVGEQGQHLGEVDGTGSFLDHLVQLLLGHQLADLVEGRSQVRFVDDAVLVGIHEGEALRSNGRFC